MKTLLLILAKYMGLYFMYEHVDAYVCKCKYHKRYCNISYYITIMGR